MSKRFFARFNPYGSDTDVGFSNTNQAFTFVSRAARDEFVAIHAADNLSVAPISTADALRMTPRDYDGRRTFRTELGYARI